LDYLVIFAPGAGYRSDGMSFEDQHQTYEGKMHPVEYFKFFFIATMQTPDEYEPETTDFEKLQYRA